MALQEEPAKVDEQMNEKLDAEEVVVDEKEPIVQAEVVPDQYPNSDENVVDESLWENTEEEHRQLWTSRISFILAAIGSAVGLGNFWRFPFQVYKYGGGTFFIPYLLALFVVGVPMMQLEMAVGQVFRRAAMQGFARLHRRMPGLGLAGAWLAFSVVTYYIGILAWGNVMLIKSFYKDMPWDIRNVNGTDVVAKPAGHFGSAILQGAPTTIIPEFIDAGLLTGALAMWAVVWWILINGQAFISKAVWVTVLMPVAMLLILLIVGASLDGAGLGVDVYLTRWDFDELSNAEMWTDAFGQVFFSLGLAFGTMPAYASFNERNNDIVKDALIISVCDALFSFFAGFAVFTIVGFFSFETGIPINDDLPIGGASLAFVTYPAGLSLLKGAWANITCIMFFVTFFFLGIDSAFSLIEAVVHNLHETVHYARWSREEVTTYVVQISALFSLFYITDNGIYWLDFSDVYINSFGVFGIGFLEAFTAMWMFNKPFTMSKVGKTPIYIFDCGFWASMLLFVILAFTLPEKDSFQKDSPEEGENAWESGRVLGISIGTGLAGIILTTIVSVSQKPAGMSIKDALYYITLHGPDTLKNMFNRTITKDRPKNWKFTLFWAFTVKFLVCPTLFILFCTKVSGMIKSKGYDGGLGDSEPIDEGFVLFYNIFGLIIVLIAAALTVAGCIFPKAFRDAKGERIAREKLTEIVQEG